MAASANADPTIIELVGAADNFSEPMPAWNDSSFLIAVTVVFLILTWLSVSFRMYTRLRIIYSPGWDDVFVMFFLITGTAGGIFVIIATQHGLGKHYLLLPLSDQLVYFSTFYAANATMSMSTALVKLSLLFQYLRIFKEERIMRRICIGLIWFVSLWGSAITFISWAPCFPMSAYWNLGKDGVCYGFGASSAAKFFACYAAVAASNMVMDIIILLIPLPLYLKKNTPRNTRISLLMLFLMGVLVTFLSAWRLATIVEHRAATYPTFDPTWYAPASMMLGVLEVNVTSICACIPIFWPVITARLDKIFVTHEIQIETSHRFSNIEDDGIELHGDGQRSTHSRGTSEASLRHQTSRDTRTGRGDHYQDDYIMAQVDPFSSKGKVHSKVTSQRDGKK